MSRSEGWRTYLVSSLQMTRGKECSDTNLLEWENQFTQIGKVCANKIFPDQTASRRAYYLRNRSALAVNCCVIIYCLEVSCKEDQITSAQRE